MNILKLKSQEFSRTKIYKSVLAVSLGIQSFLICGVGSIRNASAQEVVSSKSRPIRVHSSRPVTKNSSGNSATANPSLSGVSGKNGDARALDGGARNAPGTQGIFGLHSTGDATNLGAGARSQILRPRRINPIPIIISVSPSSIVALSGATTISVLGLNFVPRSEVKMNAITLNTTYVSPTQLTANIPPAFLFNPGVASISVLTHPPGGGLSAVLNLTIASPGQVSTTNNPQVAQYTFNSRRDATISVEFGPDTNYGLHTWSQPTPPGGGQVNILVAGMRANTTYHMRATVNFPDGAQYVDSDHTFTTGGLPPARVPQITVTNPNGLMPSPGIVLGHLWPGITNQINSAAFDKQGNLIWYYDPGVASLPFPIKLLPNGHMIANLSYVGKMREFDLAGNTIHEFGISDVNQWLANAGFSLVLVSIHHDFVTLPNGHLILLCNTNKTFMDLPGYPGQTTIVGDVLVDLDQNYDVAWVWSTFDHLDINRHLFGLPDWTHANAVLYSPDDGNLLLSMRHQSWVVKIDYQDGRGTGDILWRLGYQGDFTISSGSSADWFHAQHYPTLVSSNSIGVVKLMVMDNGNNRVLDTSGTVCGPPNYGGPNLPGYTPCYSRAPIYQIDETAKTATVLWQYNEQPVFSYWGGSAQQLDNGNAAIDFNTPSDDPMGARYLEVTTDPSPEIVLQMEVSGQNAYRITHLPSLYPGVQW